MPAAPVIRFGFSTSNWWVSRLIRWVTRSRVSHAFILIENEPILGDIVLEAAAIGFRISTKTMLTSGTTTIFQLVDPVLPLESAVQTAVAWLGERYNYEGLFGEAWVALWRRFGRRVKNPLRNSRSMFCSEAVVYILQAAHYPEADALDPQSTSPEDLLVYLNGVRPPIPAVTTFSDRPAPVLPLQ
jgi:hypothetical protein